MENIEEEMNEIADLEAKQQRNVIG